MKFLNMCGKASDLSLGVALPVAGVTNWRDISEPFGKSMFVCMHLFT